MSNIDAALYWLIIGVMLFFLELALPGFILFFFGLAALITAAVAWLTPLEIAWQLGIFIVSSVVSLITLRDIIQRNFLKPKDAGEGAEADEDVFLATPGDRAVVGVTIVPPAEGRINYSGTSWRATADEKIDEGEIVAVVHQDNLVIHVEKI
jgi:membrane protein implicated in regulation of membrane protease activity